MQTLPVAISCLCFFLTNKLSPSDEAKAVFPDDIESPSLHRREKNIVIFHDESTFNANDESLHQLESSHKSITRSQITACNVPTYSGYCFVVKLLINRSPLNKLLKMH